MSKNEVWVSVGLPRSRQTVWDFITSIDNWFKWWWGDDELVEAEPGWQVGARLFLR